MATAKDKSNAQEQWASAFPNLCRWKTNFLIQRAGALIAGICLDETRDPKTYKPTFFFHNLLVSSPVVTISYAAPLLGRGVFKPVKYGDAVDSVICDFKQQITALNNPVNFAAFVNHIMLAAKGKYGVQAVYLPHVFRDIISIGASCGDQDFFSNSLDEATSKIANTAGLNFAIIGSVDAWRSQVEKMIAVDHAAVIDDHSKQLKLPKLEDRGLPYLRIDGYWNLF